MKEISMFVISCIVLVFATGLFIGLSALSLILPAPQTADANTHHRFVIYESPHTMVLQTSINPSTSEVIEMWTIIDEFRSRGWEIADVYERLEPSGHNNDSYSVVILIVPK